MDTHFHFKEGENNMEYTRNVRYEKVAVEKYTCGSCKHYDFRDVDDTNKCEKFSSYYPQTDSCKNNWELSKDCY